MIWKRLEHRVNTDWIPSSLLLDGMTVLSLRQILMILLDVKWGALTYSLLNDAVGESILALNLIFPIVTQRTKDNRVLIW